VKVSFARWTDERDILRGANSLYLPPGGVGVLWSADTNFHLDTTAFPSTDGGRTTLAVCICQLQTP
jgi:hypothetical protein